MLTEGASAQGLAGGRSVEEAVDVITIDSDSDVDIATEEPVRSMATAFDLEVQPLRKEIPLLSGKP